MMENGEGVDANVVVIPDESLLLVFYAIGAEETFAYGQRIRRDVSHYGAYSPRIKDEITVEPIDREVFPLDFRQKGILLGSTSSER